MLGAFATRLAVSLALAAAAVSAANAQIVLRIGGANDDGYLPAYAAADKTLFASRGLDIKFVDTDQDALVPALSAGTLEIAAMPAARVLEAVCAGADLVVIAGASRRKGINRTVALLARPDAGISQPADLKGRQVGILRAAPVFARMFEIWLHRNGLQLDDLRILNVQSDDVPELFRTLALDAAIIAQPAAGRMIRRRQAMLVSYYLQDLATGSISGVYAASRPWAARNTSTIALFRSALQSGQHLVASDATLVARLLDTRPLRRLGAQDYFVAIDESHLTFTYQLGVALNQLDCQIDLKALIAN